MRPVIVEGFIDGSDSPELRIEASLCRQYPFVLDCDRLPNGNKTYLELSRPYKTMRGAKVAAARIVGDSLIWREPPKVEYPSTEQILDAIENS